MNSDLSVYHQEMNTREKEGKKGDKLKRAKSYDTTDSATSELRRQLEQSESVTSQLKRQLAQAQTEVAEMKTRLEAGDGGKTDVPADGTGRVGIAKKRHPRRKWVMGIL